MAPTDTSFLAALNGFSKSQIQQAGQRYTPGIDPSAPNLKIESLATAIENAACGTGALTRFSSVLDAFSDVWNRAASTSQHREAIEQQVRNARAYLPSLMNRLRARDAAAVQAWADRLSDIDSQLSSDIDHWRAEEAKLRPVDGDDGRSSTLNSIRGNMNAIGRCLSVLRDEKEYIESPAFKALFSPLLLVNGEWGTGKTHLLCDVTQDRICRGKATIIALAKNFHGNVITDICKRINIHGDVTDTFDRLEVLAAQTGERALIIVDGVNEGRRREWRDAVTNLIALVAGRPHLGLIISCRTPFEGIAINQDDLQKLYKLTHRGFDDQEFDAQAAFFEYYSLPLPEVPLLDREFSRPLTLKLICQSLQDLTGKKLSQGFAGIASGQKGMTYVLESFVKRVGEPIEHEYGLKPKGCWVLLKGDNKVSDQRLAGFAPCMATNLRDYVRPSEADRIIAANYPALRPARRRQLVEALRTNGLIEEDAVWYSSGGGGKSRVVFRLPYQRFSDHLIARHLLNTYLDRSSAETIKQSFRGKSPLARVFAIPRHYYHEYAEPGWAQALITEFPERVRKQLPSQQCELFFVLAKKSQDLNAYFDPFVEGIFWRDPAAFTEGTRLIVNQYLHAGSSAWDRMVDALAAVATKPKHPYHARRLYAMLARFPMPDRDLQWSEFLRREHVSPTIRRLLTWAKKLDAANMTLDAAKELVVLLSLVLTTVVRNDRDLATKALVLIGERFPEILFPHVLACLGFNDPYVPERMLAAAYGATLSLADSAVAATFRPLLGQLAIALHQEMFAPSARYATHHTLARDYALGIIEVALRTNSVALPKAANRDLATPFPNTPSTFTSDGTPDPAVKTAIGNAIKMDFGNYTIGRLIPNRRNYDNKQPEYVRVRAKIERRMFDLGYREEQFKQIDTEIGRTSWNAADDVKVDRYGKKYSWIAYFEMWGEREVANQLPDWRLGERTSDCGVDPSFPKRPPVWKPPMPDLFGDLGVNTEAWVRGGFTPTWQQLLAVREINGHKGDWILLEGFVQGVDEVRDRELVAFLRGVFVAHVNLNSFRTRFLCIDYPGNGGIPDGATENYLFAGEAGRCWRFARHLLQKNGQYRRQVATAFDSYESEPLTENTLRATIENEQLSSDGSETRASRFEIPGSRTKLRHIPGVRVEIPHVSFGWESYHSPHNDFSGFDLPAASLIQRLGLASKNREVDFYDSMGYPATLFRDGGSEWNGTQHKLLYIRADLLRRYLAATRQVLVWCNWGERDWQTKTEGINAITDAKRQEIYATHRHIHRSFFQWSAKDSKVIEHSITT